MFTLNTQSPPLVCGYYWPSWPFLPLLNKYKKINITSVINIFMEQRSGEHLKTWEKYVDNTLAILSEYATCRFLMCITNISEELQFTVNSENEYFIQASLIKRKSGGFLEKVVFRKPANTVSHPTLVLRNPTFFFSSLLSAITVHLPRSCLAITGIA